MNIDIWYWGSALVHTAKRRKKKKFIAKVVQILDLLFQAEELYTPDSNDQNQ